MTSQKSETTGPESQTKTARAAAVVMSILLLVFFLGTSDNQMISPLLPRIAQEFGLEVGNVGPMLGPAYAIAAAVAALVVGPLSDIYGRRMFLLYASVVFGASLLAAAAMPNASALAAVRLLTGLAAGTFSTCSIAYVGDYFPYERRGVAMSVVQSGYFAALVFGVPLANLLAKWQSWRVSFALFGALSAVAFLLIATLLPDDRHALAEDHLDQRFARRFDNIKTIFQRREPVASIAAAFCVSGGFVGFLLYLVSWLEMSLGLKTGQVNIFFVVVGVAALVGALAAGPIADRLGKRGLSILSTAVLAAMLLVIPRLDWGALLFACFLGASLAFAFRQGPLQALATELVPRRARGALVSLRNTASQVGIAVSTAVSGYLYDGSGYVAVGLFSAAVTIAAAVFIYMMKEPQPEIKSVEGQA
jgi:predicted MFS family arabinose efflux permease